MKCHTSQILIKLQTNYVNYDGVNYVIILKLNGYAKGKDVSPVNNPFIDEHFQTENKVLVYSNIEDNGHIVFIRI